MEPEISSTVANIPEVNLEDFLSGDEHQKEHFVSSLGHAFETIGFVAVREHGIDEQLIQDFYDVVKDFFDLPKEVKQKYEIEGLAGQRGYTSFGREHAKHSEVADLKEFWQIGQEVEDEDSVKEEYPPNVQVEEVSGFNRTGNALYRAFEECGTELMRAIALFLNLDENYFDDKIHNGNSILRAIYYPPILEDPQTAIRAEQHEDINLITLLVGASAEGLEVLNRKNEWVPVTAPPGYIVVNVGDMLQRLTNDMLRSTTHRVVNPPRELWTTPRLSIPFFLHPRSDMRLDCLPNCISEDRPKQYEAITAGEYLEERLREIGLKS